MSDLEPIELGSFPITVYLAMFGGTLGGQFLGISFDAAVLGRRVVWVPFLFSVVLEAVLGERVGAARLGRPMTLEDRGRLSGYYSICLGALSIPLAGWTVASRSPEALGGASAATAVAVAVVALAVLTVVRMGLMAAFARRGA